MYPFNSYSNNTTMHSSILINNTPTDSVRLVSFDYQLTTQLLRNHNLFDMAPPKTPNYVTLLKKLKKDLIDSTSPPVNKKFKKME
jgi:hypothetical protein